MGRDRTGDPLLVIAHEATRTGSVMVLEELLRRAAPSLGLDIAIRLLAGGPMEQRLRALETHHDPAARPAAVLVNSALGAAALWSIPDDVAALVYVHEEGDALANLSTESQRALTHRAHRVLAVTERARDHLVRMGVQSTRVTLLPPLVSVRPPSTHEVRAALHRAGLETAPPVIACGEATWRKGADLFVDVARQVTRSRPTTTAWIGRRPRAFGRILDNDTAVTGSVGRLVWLGEMVDPAPLMASARVLVMPSREDPQPLVPLEAALLGVPTVGFDVGGIATMAHGGAAVAVPYPDTGAMATEVLRMLDDDSARDSLATTAANWVRDHHDPDRVTAQFIKAVTAAISFSERLPR